MSQLMRVPPWTKRNFAYDISKRYPTGVSRIEYTMPVGDLRQIMTGEALTELLEPLGYEVETAKVNSHNTDVIVKDRAGRIILAVSVKNEKSTSYFTPLVYRGMMRDLSGAIYQLIICSFGNILIEGKPDEWDSISSFDDVIALGYQTLPEKYHNYYSANDDVYKRRVENENTYEDLKKRLEWYLIRIGLLPKTDLVKSTFRHVCSIYDNIDSNTSNMICGAPFGPKNVLCGCSKHVSKDVLKVNCGKTIDKTKDSLDKQNDSMDKEVKYYG
jgi:hypothetical protein